MENKSAISSEPGMLDAIVQLRDEIRLTVHLAGLDAKEKWQKLEEQLQSLENQVATEGGSVASATTQLARDLKQSLVDFRDRLTH
jgi:type IV secretory pathway VirB4 component